MQHICESILCLQTIPRARPSKWTRPPQSDRADILITRTPALPPGSSITCSVVVPRRWTTAPRIQYVKCVRYGFRPSTRASCFRAQSCALITISIYMNYDMS